MYLSSRKQCISTHETLVSSLLSYLMQPKPVSSEASTSEPKEKEYTSRISDAISSSIFSIGDLFKDVRDGPKSVKFPEKLLKVLEQRLQNIAMGRDATCAFCPSNSFLCQYILSSLHLVIQIN